MIKSKLNFDIQTNSKIKINIDIIEIPVYVYITVCCINNYSDIFNKLIDSIYNNKSFYNLINEIRLIIFHSDNDFLLQKFYSHPKIKIIKKFKNNFGNNTEFYSLNLLREHSMNTDFYVFYLHTKGVSERHQNKISQNKINNWIDYLLYFNINYYNYILNNLSNYSAIGVDLNGNNCNKYYSKFKNLNELVDKEGLLSTNYPYHYGGNFWWSKSDYIKKIDKCEETYPGSEFFITNGNRGEFGKFLCLYNSKNNFYRTNYTKDKYTNQKLNTYVYINY